MSLDKELDVFLKACEEQDFLDKKILWKVFNAIKYKDDIDITFKEAKVLNVYGYYEFYIFGDFVVAYDYLFESIKVYAFKKSDCYDLLRKHFKIFFADHLVFSYFENELSFDSQNSSEKTKISDMDMVEVNIFVKQFFIELIRLIEEKKTLINSDGIDLRAMKLLNI